MDPIEESLSDYFKTKKLAEEAVARDAFPPAPASIVTRAKALVGKSGSQSAECPHCRKPITPFKKPISQQRFVNGAWLTGAILAFLLSFAFPGYFVQCVAAALLFGVKWAVNSKNTRTQVLIYKALKEEGGSDAGSRIRDLHRDSSHL